MGWAEKSKENSMPPSVQALVEAAGHLLIRVNRTEQLLQPAVGLQIRRPDFGRILVENQAHIMRSLMFLINETVGAKGYPKPIKFEKRSNGGRIPLEKP